MRLKRAILNTVCDFSMQFISIICGFIVPRLILAYFGSEVNGIVASITQFLGYIILLEAGAGGVIKAAFYKPLAEKNYSDISGLLVLSEKFFKKVAYVFIIYMLVLSIGYPLIIDDFSHIYTGSLVLIIGISTIAQYYFGLSYQLLLGADQKSYLLSGLQIITIVINTLLVILLINIGAGIHLIKLASSLIFVLRPIFLYFYTKRKYTIDRSVKINNQLLKQRWDGLATHIAFFIHKNTDIVVITVFSSIKEVSVYSIYLFVVTGLGRVIDSISYGISSALGNMLAKNENASLKSTFGTYELLNNIMVTVLFTSCGLLVIPFVGIYTAGIYDANYIRPVFAYIFIVAEAIYYLRSPYATLVYAAGLYKQTKYMAYIEAGINIVISVTLISFFGITGVAIGTLVAMAYRTFMFALFLSNNLIFRNIAVFIRRLFISIFSSLCVIIVISLIPYSSINTYFDWFLYAILVTIISVVTIVLIFFVFECREMLILIKKFKHVLSNHSTN